MHGDSIDGRIRPSEVDLLEHTRRVHGIRMTDFGVERAIHPDYDRFSGSDVALGLEPKGLARDALRCHQDRWEAVSIILSYEQRPDAVWVTERHQSPTCYQANDAVTAFGPNVRSLDRAEDVVL